MFHRAWGSWTLNLVLQVGLVEDWHFCQDLFLLLSGVPCDVDGVGWASPNFHDVEPVKSVHNAGLKMLKFSRP